MPQWIAGTFLLVFLTQCAWLVTHNLRSGQMDLREWYRLDTGLRLWHRTPRTAAAAAPHPRQRRLRSRSFLPLVPNLLCAPTGLARTLRLGLPALLGMARPPPSH